MKPVDRSDAHLQDRAVEFRVLKGVVVVFLTTVPAVFSSWLLSVAVFALGYALYQFRYYTNRVGVYTNADLSVRHDRLEYGLFGFAGVTVATLLAIQTVFEESWGLGGFLSLPAIEFTNLQAVLDEPMVLLAWLIVLAPVVAVSYVGLQFRKRLLVGVDSEQAAVRATIWDSLGRLPIAVLWIAVLTLRPVYEVWKPAVDRLGGELALPLQTESGFAVLFGESFEVLIVGCLVAPGVIFTSYLAVQQQKYGNGTVPEVLGYRGFSPPFRGSHQVNLLVPTGVYALYAGAVILTVGTDAVVAQSLLAAVGVSVLVGADLLAKTTTVLRAVSGRVAEAVDAVAVGLIAGFVVVLVLTPAIGSEYSIGTLTLLYPLLAVPLTYGGNWLAGKRAARRIEAYSARVEEDWDAFDEQTVDRLFIYSDARNQSLRSAAIRGLASSIAAQAYRQDEALSVFVDALWSTETALVHAGLRGIATDLSYDQSPQTYDWLASVGAIEQFQSLLDSDDPDTRALAAEAAARAHTVDLTTRGTANGTSNTVGRSRLTESHLSTMSSVVEHNTQNVPLVGAVAEYFATLWYFGSSRDNEIRPTDSALQRLLGDALWLTAHSDQYARDRVVFALTGERAVADERRLSLALDTLDSEHVESRYAAAHVVHSSMDRHADSVDSDRLVALLDDHSPAVRSVGAASLVALLGVAPARGPALQDRLLVHLEQHQESPGRTEGTVLRALAQVSAESLLDHPTAASTIAGFVDVDNRLVADPAARLLTALVESSVSVTRQDEVRSAIETGLTHDSDAVRLACLEAVVLIVDDSVDAGRGFVEGLGVNLETRGRHGVLAAATLAQIVDAHPETGLDVLPELSRGLTNGTPVDSQTVPFLVRGETVSAVVVDIVADAVALDPSRGVAVIDPLVDLAPTAERSTLDGIVGTLSELSAEFPAETQGAVGAAAGALDEGRVSIRGDAAQILANVAAYHPDTVAPFVDRLVVATEDSSPRVRAPALVALRNVCTALPEAIEDDIHQVVGRLDDESAIVRKRAADLISTVAERQPDIIDPAAETADRLRRLQRDPAVDVDPEELQDASTAIQTGVAADEVDSGDSEEIWTPESADEMGVSGDTEVFEPVGDDFDPDFDDEFAAEESGGGTDADGDEETAAAVGERDTVVGGDQSGDSGGEPDDQGADSSTGDSVESQETVIAPDEPEDETGERTSADEDISSQETVIDPDSSDQEDEGENEEQGDEEQTNGSERGSK